MNRKEQNVPQSDRETQDALRDEANKPEPLYDKTNRNFQRQSQDQQQGNNHDKVSGTDDHDGSSSPEEKDII